VRAAIAAVAASARTWRLALVVLMVAVSYLALSPKPPAGVDLGWDKLNHMTAFTALGFCALLGFGTTRRALLAASCGLLAFGGLIEVLQLAAPGRSSEWGDLLADAVGIAVGMAIGGGLRWGMSDRPRAIR
jgi:VanZ family protein